jgi:pimeloyl-ACP methyl ester carboxylesterase
MSNSVVADLWVKLITELGYETFVAASGDVGSGVTKALALQHPGLVTAIHLTDVGYGSSWVLDFNLGIRS